MADKKYPSDKQDKFMLRLPEGMRDRIRLESEKIGRSMNAEIVARLERSLSEGATPEYRSSAAALKEEIRQEIRDELAGMIREAIKGAATQARPEKDE